jgi:hypothetical protein
MVAGATGGPDPPPAPSGEPPAPPVTPPIAPVAQGETVTRPEAAPVTRAEARIGAGLPFWKPLMWVVGGSIAGLVFVLLIVGCAQSRRNVRRCSALRSSKRANY